MERVANKRVIFTQFLEWYLWDQPKAIFKAWMNILKFNLNYFSILLLLKTFFAPWRRYAWSYGRGFDFKRYLEAFTSNVILRGLGAILRFCLIIIGISLEILLFFGGLFFLICWFLFPVILVALLVLGIKVFF